MNITIVGGGNMGLALASELSIRTENDITVLCSRAFDVADLVFEDAEEGKEYTNLDFKATSNTEQALKDADYILCTYPAFLRREFLERAKSLIRPGSKLGFIPGYGGAEYGCTDLISKGVTVFGLQRVPYVARQSDRKKAAVLSKKKTLYLAALPKEKTNELCEELYQMLGIPVQALHEYLAVTLVPSNPLLHLTGLYHVFKDYKEGDHYEEPMMFYEEWDDSTSELLFEYDTELQEICSRMAPLDLSEVVSLRIYYESPEPEDLTRKLKSIPSLYNVVKVPLVEKDGKYYPDYTSRMFTEDFPYGIAIIKYFAILTGTDTPAIDKILQFYKDKTGISYFEGNEPGKDFYESGIPAVYGLDTLDKIIDFYRK